MKEIMKMPNLEARWDSEEVTGRILEMLSDKPVKTP